MPDMNAPASPSSLVDPLVIAGRAYRSRLLVGTGKYRDFNETRAAIVASGADCLMSSAGVNVFLHSYL